MKNIKRLWPAAVVFVVVLGIALSACHSASRGTAEPDPSGSVGMRLDVVYDDSCLPYLMQWDGELYRVQSWKIADTYDVGPVVGQVTSVCHNLPEEDGQANVPIEGASIAKVSGVFNVRLRPDGEWREFSDALALQLEGEWCWLLPESIDFFPVIGPSLSYPDLLKWDGEWYCWWGETVEDVSAVGPVEGAVTSTCGGNNIPAENGQVNFSFVGAPADNISPVGAPIAACGEGIAIQVEGQWLWLPPENAGYSLRPHDPFPQTVRWNGAWYCYWGETVGDTSAIGPVVDHVTAMCPVQYMPIKDGQTNFALPDATLAGAPIATYGDGIAVQVNDEWLWLRPYKTGTDLEGVLNTCPCSVQWNGKLYIFWGGKVTDTSTIGSVIGEVKSTVDISIAPEEDGQANFSYYGTSLVGAPIAEWGEGIAIQMDGEWLPLHLYESD